MREKERKRGRKKKESGEREKECLVESTREKGRTRRRVGRARDGVCV